MFPCETAGLELIDTSAGLPADMDPRARPEDPPLMAKLRNYTDLRFGVSI
jgi:hypothetical protein